jgi:hypothetical protein
MCQRVMYKALRSLLNQAVCLDKHFAYVIDNFRPPAQSLYLRYSRIAEQEQVFP